MVDHAIQRAVAGRYAAAAAEIEKILVATYAVVERSGSFDPRIKDILDEAGLSTQAFYRHFKSKDELMLALIDEGLRMLASYLEHRMSKSDDPIAAIRAWIEGTMQQARDDRAAIRTRSFIENLPRFRSQYPEECRRSVMALVSLLHAPLREAHAAGQIDVKDPDRAAVLIYTVTQGAFQRHLEDMTKPRAADIDELLDFCLYGLHARQRD